MKAEINSGKLLTAAEGQQKKPWQTQTNDQAYS